jgi:hypothetical protein
MKSASPLISRFLASHRDAPCYFYLNGPPEQPLVGIVIESDDAYAIIDIGGQQALVQIARFAFIVDGPLTMQPRPARAARIWLSAVP